MLDPYAGRDAARDVGPWRPPAPAPLRAARVLVWIQIGCWGLGLAAGAVVAGRAAADLDGAGESYAGLGVALGLLLGVVCLVALALLVPPVVLLRNSRRGTRTGSLIGLCVGQGLTAAPATLGLLALPRVGHLGGALSFGVVTLAAVVISLALQPASRAWAELP